MPSFAVAPGFPCLPNNPEPIPGISPQCGGAQCPDTGGGGGIADVVTVDSETISFSGNGTPTSPLSAETNLEPDNLYTKVEFVMYTSSVQLDAGEEAYVYVAPEETIFAVNFGDSIGRAAIGITARFAVTKNSTEVGEINIIDGLVAFGTVGFSLARGDILALVPEDTLTPSFIAFTLVASVPVRYSQQ